MRFKTLCLIVFTTLFLGWGAAYAQNIPNFWDPQERFVKPNVKGLPRLRFLTTTDFPPFSYIDKDKRLSGFHVDLARAVCAELEVMPVCQIQAVPFGKLQSELASGGGDAIIAGLSVTPSTRQQLMFTRPYFRLPSRFVAKKSIGVSEPLWRNMGTREVGVVEGTAHAAFAKANFGKIRLRLFDTLDGALSGLQKGEIAAVFGDGLRLSFWLQNQPAKSDCCAFFGDAYLSSAYFGQGLSIAVSQNDRELVDALNFALKSISDKGKFGELYLRYFPISLF